MGPSFQFFQVLAGRTVFYDEGLAVRGRNEIYKRTLYITLEVIRDQNIHTIGSKSFFVFFGLIQSQAQLGPSSANAGHDHAYEFPGVLFQDFLQLVSGAIGYLYHFSPLCIFFLAAIRTVALEIYFGFSYRKTVFCFNFP